MHDTAVKSTRKTNVKVQISDLFFNWDHREAEQHDTAGQFAGWDHAKMISQANSFLAMLGALNIPVPSAEDMVDDFLARVRE